MTGELHEEIAKLQALKQEHASLLHHIVADAGMNPDLRRHLVEHIHEEEDEHVAKIAALTAGQGELGAHAPVSQPAPAAPSGLTVGSLRPSPPSGEGPGSVGSLRLSAPMARGGAGSVGSLWRR